MSLSAGTPNLLGAPTIDVSGLGTPNPATVGAAPPIAGAAPPIADPVLPDIVKEEELEYLLNVRTARSGTVPLFDMTAVLPAASSSLKSASPSSAATREVDKPRAIAPTSSGRVRERKFVIAPETSTAPRARRSSAALWFGLFAVAASIAVAGGLRARRPTLASVEPRAMLSAAPVVSSPIATVAAALPAPEDSAGNAALPAPEASVANAAPSAAFPNHPTPAPRAPSTISTPASAKTASPHADANANAEPTEKLAVAAAAEPAAPTLEKPAANGKPQAARNAPPAAEPGTEFDRGAARDALASAAAQASSCRKEGDPSGTASITITFAPSGRVTTANLQGPPFAGTATGGCIANTMRHASVPAFVGEYVTVTKTIVVQ